jgi:hypothetical protein
VADNASIMQFKKLNDQMTRRLIAGKTKMRNLFLCSAAPTVDAGSQATYPLYVNDLVYDYTNDDIYQCTVAPTASTAATFTKVVG